MTLLCKVRPRSSVMTIGLNVDWGKIIYIRLRPQRDPKSFLDMHTILDTMLHELVHNAHSEHDKDFYSLLDVLKAEGEMLSSKGYQGEGFFSQGKRLGKGHMWYRPSLTVSAADRRRVKEAAERKARGEAVGGVPVGGVNAGADGRRLGGALVPEEIDPKRLAAVAAEQRARDKRSCGSKHGGMDMKRERDKADRQGQKTQANDIWSLIDLNDIQNYDLDDSVLPPSLGPVPGANGLRRTTPDRGSGLPWQSDWTCKQCTVRNPPLYLSCNVCQAERDLQVVDLIDLTAGGGGTDSWDCQACTFRNENVIAKVCIVCGTGK